MVISRAMLDDVVAHAREEYDAECCGMIAYGAAPDGLPPQATRVHRARNIYASRKRFEIDGKELLHTIEEFESSGWDRARSTTPTPTPSPTRPRPTSTSPPTGRGSSGSSWASPGIRRTSAVT